MPRALVDTTVLFAAAYSRDQSHEAGLAILRGIDDGSLPEVVVTRFVLAETLNGLATHAGHDAAVDFLDRLEHNDRIHIEALSTATFASAKSRFRRHRSLSLVDACLVAYADTADLAYLYTFDDDFDAVDIVTRLDTPSNPYGTD